MTGAPLPSGCDCVVPVEKTSGFAGGVVSIRATASPGKHVTPRGREHRAGDEILRPGQRLDAAGVGALALVGRARVPVGRRARVSILSTGNELVALGSPVGPFQIHNSNGPMLASLAAPFAAEIVALGIAGDTLAAIEAALRRGMESDLLLVTGGVSMGAYDLVAAALARCGVRIHFERVALQPGKPTVFGTHAAGAVLALPGNPVSALTTFRLFGACALRRLEGESDSRPRWLDCPAGFAWGRRHAKWVFLPGVRAADGARVELVPYAGSGDLLAYVRADCQVVLPPDRMRVEPGEPVPIWPL
jgi:molybdopterin molybdotransferase